MAIIEAIPCPFYLIADGVRRVADLTGDGSDRTAILKLDRISNTFLVGKVFFLFVFGYDRMKVVYGDVSLVGWVLS